MKLRKIYLIFMFCFFCGACSTIIPSYELEEINNICKDNGGVYEIDIAFSYNLIMTITCNDGTAKSIE